ncbi:MAG: PIN domain-containing protein, partial [Candidatus Hodarchaeales archaeon]
MPVLDTMVLFGAADSDDPTHKEAKAYIDKVTPTGDYWLPSFALIEFDLVLRSRGKKAKEKMDIYLLFEKDFSEVSSRCLPINATALYHLARLEDTYRIDYFDAGIVAQALTLDGIVVTKD